MKQRATFRTSSRATSPAAGILQRHCGCGLHGHGKAPCSRCSKKRGASLQRVARRAGPSPAVPAVVHEVLRTPGRPIDAAPRAVLEGRFGRDFSQVKVHTDARAAESAAAVDALAYTVGRHVVFAAGQYAPGSPGGLRLLAHELTHVLQQGAHPGAPPAGLRIGESADRWEREAEAAADAVAVGARPAAIAGRPGPALLQKDGGTGAVCGPDVTAPLKQSIKDTEAAFAGWTTDQKEESCEGLVSIWTGDGAWDIVDLHNNAWILDYRPACASQGQEPKCGSSVQVESDCYYAGSVNYVIFGTMCRACFGLYDAQLSSMSKPSWWEDHMPYLIAQAKRQQFTKEGMLDLVETYKGSSIFTGWTESKNYGPSREWSKVGYAGWPTAKATLPAGDRSNCHPVCPLVYGSVAGSQKGPFRVHWYPHSTLETMRRRTQVPR